MKCLPSLLAVALLAGSTVSNAAEDSNWSFQVYAHTPPRASGMTQLPLPALSTFTGLKPEEVSKKYRMCLLLPQTQDTVFMAYIYAAVDEAKRLGQAMTVFDAGGYGNSSVQHAQFENCLTLGANAILLEPINPSGWDAELAAAQAQGVKIINVTEAVDAPVDGRSLVDFRLNGRLAGEFVAKQGPKSRVLVLPGPAGVPFVEDTISGFKEASKSGEVTITNVMYGELDATNQLKLVEDALVANPDIDYIFGNAVAIKQAVNVLAQRGMSGKIKLVSSYVDPDVLVQIKTGAIEAAAAESSVILKRIGVDLALAALEGKGVPQDVVPEVQLVTRDNVNAPGIARANFPPLGWKATFKTE